MGGGQLLQYLLSGVTTGSVYAIVGIGFTIIYNSTGIINFAQGEFLMLGGMIAVSLRHLMPLPLAVAVAVLATGSRRRPAAARVHLLAEEPRGIADDHHHDRAFDPPARSRPARLGREGARPALLHRR